MDSIRVLRIADPAPDDSLSTRLVTDDRVTTDSGESVSVSAARDRLADPETRVDCVVTDADVGETEGLAFLQSLREDYPDVPVVLRAEDGSEAIASEATALGVVDYLPGDPDDERYERLLDRVQEVVERRRLERQAADHERVEQRGELRRSRRRFESLFQDPNLFVALLHPDGTLLDVNQTALAYVDATREAVIGEPFWDTPWWSEELRSVVRRKFEQAADGEYVEYETDLTYPNGQSYSVSGSIRPVTDDAGEVVSLIAAGRDVTERVKRERVLERQSQQFDDFAAAITHELRNTLAIVDGYLEIATEDDPAKSTDVVADAERRLRDAIERMERVVDDLSTLARYGQPIDDPEDCELRDAAETAHDAICPDGVDLSVEASCTVAADRPRLVELFRSVLQFAELRDASTVTVSCDADGFAIAIDCEPLSVDEVEGAFEYGEAVPSAETGMLLPTVRTLGRVHGWTVALDPDDTNGIRLRVGNVTVVERSAAATEEANG